VTGDLDRKLPWRRHRERDRPGEGEAVGSFQAGTAIETLAYY